VQLNYDVDLSFTEKPRIGDLRGGLLFGDAIYLVDRALFVLSHAAGPEEIEFEVPQGFAVATPWHKIADHRFRAADNRDLTENWPILGRFPIVEFKEGEFQVTFAMPGVTAGEQQLLQPLFKPILHEYLRICRRPPPLICFLHFFMEPKKTAKDS
jgi:hypothetical protein